MNIGKQKSLRIFSNKIGWIRKDNFSASAKKFLFKFRKELINTQYADIQIGKWWEYVIKYVFPIEFVAVFGFFIYEKLQDQNESPIEGMGLGLFTIITMILQWAIILIIFMILGRIEILTLLVFIKKFFFKT